MSMDTVDSKKCPWTNVHRTSKTPCLFGYIQTLEEDWKYIFARPGLVVDVGVLGDYHV
jgi:hypothetical protein